MNSAIVKTRAVLAVILAAILCITAVPAAAEEDMICFEEKGIYVKIPDSVMYVTGESPDTAPHYLQDHPVLGGTKIGNHWLHGVRRLLKVFHHHLHHFLRNAFHIRANGFNGTVLLIGYVVHLRDIDPWNGGRPAEILSPGHFTVLILLIKVQQRVVALLTLTDVEHIEKVIPDRSMTCRMLV